MSTIRAQLIKLAPNLERPSVEVRTAGRASRYLNDGETLDVTENEELTFACAGWKDDKRFSAGMTVVGRVTGSPTDALTVSAGEDVQFRVIGVRQGQSLDPDVAAAKRPRGR